MKQWHLLFRRKLKHYENKFTEDHKYTPIPVSSVSTSGAENVNLCCQYLPIFPTLKVCEYIESEIVAKL